MEKFVFHVISLPHTQTTREYISCAYTQKVIKFADMMTKLGHTVYVYSSEENEAECAEHISLVSKKEQAEWFGDQDYKSKFYHLYWNTDHDSWQTMNSRAVTMIREKRHSDRDFVCVIGGVCQKQIAEELSEMLTVEFGIGYSGIFAAFKVFESYAWMHNVYGAAHIEDGQFFDTVIPNYFDPDDFEFSAEKEDYVLYIGRMISRKGIQTAVEATKRSGHKLLLAGQGVTHWEPGRLETAEFTIESDNIEFIGHLDLKARSDVMKKARAVMLCTNYIEPFGGTSIEPLFCGTPVITTDWGAFSENNIHGLSGYRGRTIGEFVWALNNVDKLDPYKIREYAINNFSLDRCAELYQTYFEQLNTLGTNGWYSDWNAGVAKYNRYTKIL